MSPSTRRGPGDMLTGVINSRYAGLGASLLGFLGGTFVLVPVEPLYLPLMLAQRGKALWYATLLLIGNVAGGAFMYGVGAMAAVPLIEPLFEFLLADGQIEETSELLREDGFKTLFLIGVTPFPFQLGTAVAGVVSYSFPLFLVAIALSRGIRYFGIAILVLMFGRRFGHLIDQHQSTITALGAIVFLLAAMLLLFTN